MVYFVGAGTGAADLITVRGMRLLGQADVIIYAGSLVNPELLTFAKEDCDIYNSASLTLEEVIEIMEEAEARGQTTVRLHTGEPSIYGAVREQMDELEQLGIPYESCPGVTACFGAAASLNLEYTLPGISQSLIITRMEGRTEVPKKESIESFAMHQASMAVYLSAGMIKELSERLIKGGYPEETPAALVYKATWQEEESYVCTVKTLYDTAKRHGITKTALVLVGEAIAHHHYQKSRLYAPDYSTEFRQAKRGKTHIKELPRIGRLSVISFTENGTYLSRHLAAKLPEETGIEITLYTGSTAYAKMQEDMDKTQLPTHVKNIGIWARKQLKEKNAILFIGACGIAVRSVAPYLTDKLQDAPVLVMDEKGQHIIPILSGHLGGGNELARFLAEKLGAEPVITTATDLNGKFAVDVFARRNEMQIANKDGIAKVSAKALCGEEITISIEKGHYNCRQGGAGAIPQGVRIIPYPPADSVDVLVASQEESLEAAIWLIPKEYVIGFGCKKGKKEQEITDFILQKLSETGISVTRVAALSSISQKKEEQGIVSWCQKEGIPFITYSAEELQQTEGNFHTSAFVKEQVGVDNVCERAALRFCGSGGTLVLKKCAADGMTMAIAKRKWMVTFYGE